MFVRIGTASWNGTGSSSLDLSRLRLGVEDEKVDLYFVDRYYDDEDDE